VPKLTERALRENNVFAEKMMKALFT